MLRRSAPRPLALLWASTIFIALPAACGEDDDILFPGLSDEVNARLAELRSETESFKRFEDANAAGYDVLVAHPTNGQLCFRHRCLRIARSPGGVRRWRPRSFASISIARRSASAPARSSSA